MAADIAGDGGTASATGFTFKIIEWRGKLTVENVQVPPGFDEAWALHVPTFGHMAGSLIGVMKSALGGGTKPTPALPTASQDWAAFSVACSFVATTGHSYDGTFLLSNWDVGRPHAGYCSVTADFVNASAVTCTWT